jgi:hypothetical protein
MAGVWIGRIERTAEARLACQPPIEPQQLAPIDGTAEVLEQREGRAPALQLGDVGTSDAGAVAGEVDARHARAAFCAALRHPLPRVGIEDEAAAGEIGQLRLGAQAERRTDRIAVDAVLVPGSVAPAQRFDPPVAFDADRADAVAHVEPAQAIAGRVPEALRERAGRRQQSRRLRELAAERRHIERGDDADAGLRVLVRDERQQGPGTDQRDAPADRHALRLQRDLRAAEREDAGQGPAREGQHAVHRAGRQDQVIERLLAVAVGGQQIELGPEHVPDQRVRAVVDPVGVIAEHAVDRRRLLRVEAVDVGRHATACARRLAVDLAARPCRLVEDDGSQAGMGQRLGGAHARRPGADDDDDRLSQRRHPR